MVRIHAVVQAGGLGQRIRAAAGGTPKPLLTINGVSMVERLLLQLTEAGITRVTIVVGSNGEAIRARVLRLLDSQRQPLEWDFFEEHTALGNAGALAEIETGKDAVLLCFADLVTDIDFAELLAVHAQRDCNVTLTSHYEHHQLSLGELVAEGDTVRGYVEKPRKAFLICSGIAVFDAQAMSAARALPRPFGLSDLVVATLGVNLSVTHWLHQAYWIDVNTPELLNRARAEKSPAAADPAVRRQAG